MSKFLREIIRTTAITPRFRQYLAEIEAARNGRKFIININGIIPGDLDPYLKQHDAILTLAKSDMLGGFNFAFETFYKSKSPKDPGNIASNLLIQQNGKDPKKCDDEFLHYIKNLRSAFSPQELNDMASKGLAARTAKIMKPDSFHGDEPFSRKLIEERSKRTRSQEILLSTFAINKTQAQSTNGKDADLVAAFVNAGNVVPLAKCCREFFGPNAQIIPTLNLSENIIETRKMDPSQINEYLEGFVNQGLREINQEINAKYPDEEEAFRCKEEIKEEFDSVNIIKVEKDPDAKNKLAGILTEALRDLMMENYKNPPTSTSGDLIERLSKEVSNNRG